MSNLPRVTLNVDCGEGYYRWDLGPDAEIIPHVDLVNIACGFHAGDHQTMLRTVREAIKHNVGIGAHPGLDDIKGFGRRKFDITTDEVYSLALYQLGALKAITEGDGGKVGHVKPHGMLYFILRDNEDCMRAFMRAQTAVFKTSIPFFGLGGTVHEKVCKELGVPFVPEVFCDIDYTSGGTLLGVPQSNPATPESAAGKIRQMLTSQETFDIDGNALPMPVTTGQFTICMHSDLKTALDNIKAVRVVLNELAK
ncbi:hypothetical protein DB88DRAFT_488455 [Papiliotrema laurentii]|uniref:Lactam utilization protein lamB n=1 Tax=Papiliotrema laurentii TaxID=5418 RepID=A0AAD9CYS1_PAPLA|nr:hypothetical protein DB88DRAFT_488455 [Papiliotrema laurentii]